MLGVGSLADYAIASFSRDGSTDVLTLDVGTLTLTGQDIALRANLSVASATLTLAGKDFPAYRIVVDAATLTVSSSPVALRAVLGVAPAGLALSGAPSSFTTTQKLDAGQLRLLGGDFPAYRLIVDAGEILLDGQSLPLLPTIYVEPARLVLFGRDLDLRVLGGGGLERKRTKPSSPRKPLKRIERLIEVIGEDGLPKKVSLLKRFAPPPPPPPLEVLPGDFAKPLPPELLAPLHLPQAPVRDIGSDIADTLELRDVTDAMAAIAMIPDPVAEAAQRLIHDALDAVVAISLVPDPMSDHIRALIEALEQEQSQAAPEAAFLME